MGHSRSHSTGHHRLGSASNASALRRRGRSYTSAATAAPAAIRFLAHASAHHVGRWHVRRCRVRRGLPLARVRRPATFTVLAIIFVLSTLGRMSLTTMLIPVLVARGHLPKTGATVLAALGVMQLPGRVWVLRGRRAGSIRGMLALQLGRARRAG
jgi:hypothetical protein